MWTYSNELYHYGRLGMKWGQHKYMNKYGVLKPAGQVRSRNLESEYDSLSKVRTLTPKGEKRRAQIAEEYKQLTGRAITSKRDTVKKQSDPDSEAPTKKLNEMTNEELQAHNARKQLENAYLSFQPKPGMPDGKKMSEMTNEELQVYNTRKQLENTYISLQPKPEVSKARKFVSAVGTKVLAPVAIKAGQAALTKMLEKAMDKKSADDTVKKAEDAVKKAEEAVKDATSSAANKATKEAARAASKAASEAAREASKRAADDAFREYSNRATSEAFRKTADDAVNRMAAEEAKRRAKELMKLLPGPTN